MRLGCAGMVMLLVLVLLSRTGMPQAPAPSRRGLDPQQLVEFNFTNSDIATVLQHFITLTGWSVFYDAEHVTGKVTILTPGKVPLQHAMRLLQGVMKAHGHAIRVLIPGTPQPVPLTALVGEAFYASERRDVVVWRNSDARGPQSRPYDCDPVPTTYPLLPLGVDVIVDTIR